MHAVHSSAIRSGAADHYPPEVVDVWVNAFNSENFPRNIQRLEFFVAELEDGRIAGFVAFDLETGEVDSVYVAPWGGGLGLGATLLSFAEEWAKTMGLKELWLDASLNAVAFYSRFGWREARSHARVRDGVEISLVRMEKTLEP